MVVSEFELLSGFEDNKKTKNLFSVLGNPVF